jgi:hypothetical protein
MPHAKGSLRSEETRDRDIPFAKCSPCTPERMSTLTLLFFEISRLLVDVGESTQSFIICPSVRGSDGQIEWRRDESTLCVLTLGIILIPVTTVEQCDEQFPHAEGHTVYNGVWE